MSESSPANISGPWVMFLDMLGTKDSAKVLPGDYPAKLSLFKTHVTNIARNLDCRVDMRLFSDSVYFEIDNFEEAIFFCRHLMRVCFPEDIFFKGAITEGRLSEEVVDLTQKSPSGYGIRVAGSTFGPSVVSVYYAQEEFKGIGFRYIGSLDVGNERGLLVRSAFPVVNSRLKIDWIDFKDVSFAMASKPNELSIDTDTDDHSEEIEQYRDNVAFIEAVVSAALRAERSSSNLSRYYLSFLHSLISSSDFSNIDVDDDAWVSYPPIFQVLEVSQGFKSGMKRIVGSDSLYLHLFSEIHNQRRDDEGLSIMKSNSLSYISEKLVRSLRAAKVTRKSFPRLPSHFATSESLSFLAKKDVEMDLNRSV